LNARYSATRYSVRFERAFLSNGRVTSIKQGSEKEMSFRKSGAPPQRRVICKKCRNPKRSSSLNRSPLKKGSSSPESITKLQVVSAMYAYLMTSWEELPDQNKRALGFDFVIGSEGEEAALNHLARLFLEYADLTFKRALVARRRRLGVDDGRDQAEC
jgi:hypothetical protein